MELKQLDTLLSVSIGIHMAYSLLSTVHWFHLKKLENYIEYLKEFSRESKFATPVQGLPGILRVLETKVLWRRIDSKKTITLFQIICATVAVINLMIIAVAANCESISVNRIDAYIISAVAISPMPLMMVYSYFSHLIWKRQIRETLELVKWKYQDALSKEH